MTSKIRLSWETLNDTIELFCELNAELHRGDKWVGLWKETVTIYLQKYHKKNVVCWGLNMFSSQCTDRQHYSYCSSLLETLTFFFIWAV